MQTISLLQIGASEPEIINSADFYIALNDENSITERIITIHDKRYLLNSLNINTTNNGSAGYVSKEILLPTVNGQTDFLLASPITQGIYPLVTVGGLMQEQGIDYVVSGTSLKWLNNSFALTTTDRLIIYYS